MMEQDSPSYEIGLNINFLSFSFPNVNIKDKDEIIISITTIPEQNNQYYIIQKKEIHYLNHVLAVNITDNTKKIIVVFRKKSFFSKDPIIASTIIHSDDFPKIPHDINPQNLESSTTDIKIMNIYEPFQQKNKPKHEKHSELIEDQCQYQKSVNDRNNRHIVGEMQVQMFLTVAVTDENLPYPLKENNKYRKDKKLNNEQT